MSNDERNANIKEFRSRPDLQAELKECFLLPPSSHVEEEIVKAAEARPAPISDDEALAVAVAAVGRLALIHSEYTSSYHSGKSMTTHCWKCAVHVIADGVSLAFSDGANLNTHGCEEWTTLKMARVMMPCDAADAALHQQASPARGRGRAAAAPTAPRRSLSTKGPGTPSTDTAKVKEPTPFDPAAFSAAKGDRLVHYTTMFTFDATRLQLMFAKTTPPSPLQQLSPLQLYRFVRVVTSFCAGGKQFRYLTEASDTWH